MKPRSAPELLANLRNRTTGHLESAQQLLALDDPTLHQRPRPDAWNAVECLAHLNHYGDYYLPEIRRRIAAAPRGKAPDTFTSSRLGNYFATSLKPGPKSPKINTFKNANPTLLPTPPDRSVIEEFIRQQQDLLDLLDRAAAVNLTKTKTGISLTRFIKLRLGDTLRVVIYHNWRHIEQALRAAGVAKNSSRVA